MSLYKYLPTEAYARTMIDRGEILLRPLSYFRAFEDKLVRGDPDDGKLRHAPEQGLVLTKENGEVVAMPPGWKFQASVHADDIFVYCLSTELSPEIAARFKCAFCVEITEPMRLVSRIASHVRLRSKLDRHVYSSEIDYRKLSAAPGIDWALPERVAFIKPEDWGWQKEHRIAVGRKGAFAVENVDLALNVGGGAVAADEVSHPLVLHVGNLSKFATLHAF